MKLDRQHPAVPAGLFRVGDAAIMPDGSRGAIIDIGYDEEKSYHFTARFSNGDQEVVALRSDIVILPPLEELELTDPKRMARDYADENDMLIARAIGYRMDTPVYNFTRRNGFDTYTLELEKNTRTTAVVEFMDERFTHDEPDPVEDTWLVVIDGDDMPAPPDFEPRQ